ncbi:MAG: hypothetical protein ACPGU1_09250, partial [Myxococcota bacterium]
QKKSGWLESFFGMLMQPAMVTVMLAFVVGGTSVFVVQQEAGPEESAAMMAAAPDSPRGDEKAELELASTSVEAGERTAAPAAPEKRKEAGSVTASVAVADKAPEKGELRPVSPAVSRLVEVEPQVAEVAQARRTPTKKRRTKAKRVPRSKDKVALGSSSRAEPEVEVAAAVRPSADSFGLRGAPPSPSADDAAPAREPVKVPMARTAAESDAPAAESAPVDRLPKQSARSRPQPQVAAKSTASKAKGDPRAQGKRLVTEFERHLKKGDAAKAAKVLDKLAKVPGFESAAKRKRGELRSWMKARAGKRTKKNKAY